MSEEVRAVIWDLDDTFWRGTLTEGGIREYVQKHHDIVVELSNRGILNSICSKNDAGTVLPVLREKGILDYFVFPSINWDAKGPRVAQFVERSQLRPETIMFIDDNPNNRAEAMAAVPGLQVESEAFLVQLLEDPRFVGKKDADLSRLKQYKLLETRHTDAQRNASSNEDFLRSCDIRVLVDYDVAANLDRAIELINRTNQLNFTKVRLPENLESARDALKRQIAPFDCASGLIKVADRYGDYGDVGFFLVGGMRSAMVPDASNNRLIHFCFSCRTLGMFIEQWTYEFLRRPELKVVGEVITDLSMPRRVDWVTQVESMSNAEPRTAPIASRVLVYGGCEAHVLSVYLGNYATKVATFGNYAASGLFLRVAAAAIALYICTRGKETFANEAAFLGLPLSSESNDFFVSDGEPSIYVFNLGADAQGCARIRHKRHGWQFIIEPNGLPGANLVTLSEQGLEAHVSDPEADYTPSQREHILAVGRHIREHYEFVAQPRTAELAQTLVTLIEKVPAGSKLIFAVPHDYSRPRYPAPDLEQRLSIAKYRSLLRQIARNYPFAGVASVSDSIQGFQDIQEADHYSREVYLRFAQQIARLARKLPPRSSEAVQVQHKELSMSALMGAAKSPKESPLQDLASGEVVDELFQIILGRKINNDTYKAEVDFENTLGFWIKTLMESNEFADRHSRSELTKRSASGP